MKVTRKQRAYEYIRAGLLQGNLGAGDRLSPEALAREIGISHIPVREALGLLQSEGFVVQIPHRGTFVRQPDRREVEEVMGVRGLLECHAAARAARRIRATGLSELRRIVKAMRELVEAIRVADPVEGWASLPRWGELDMAFHAQVFEATGNRQLLGVVRSLVMRMSGYGYGAYRPTNWEGLLEGFAGNYRVHRDVYRAVRRRDPYAARRAMAAHMRRARQNLLIRFDRISRTHDAATARADASPDPSGEPALCTEGRPLDGSRVPAWYARRRK